MESFFSHVTTLAESLIPIQVFDLVHKIAFSYLIESLS